MASSNEQDNFDRLAGPQGGGTSQPPSTSKEPVPEGYVNSPDPNLIAKPFWRRPRALIGTAVAVIILAFTGLGILESQSPERDSSGSLVEAGTEQIDKLRVGDCLSNALEEKEYSQSGVVPCSQPHRAEVYSTNQTLSGGTYVVSRISTEAEDRCIAKFENYVGTSFDLSSLYISWFLPTPSGWAAGDRSLTCLLEEENEGLLPSGSAKGKGF